MSIPEVEKIEKRLQKYPKSSIYSFMTGKELRIKRNLLDLTQAELAEELGLNPNTVSRYENGDLEIPKTVELAMETIERRHKNEVS